MRDKWTDWFIGCMKRKVRYQMGLRDTAEAEMLRAKRRMEQAASICEAMQMTIDQAIAKQRAASIASELPLR